jgi:hypothetical protein
MGASAWIRAAKSSIAGECRYLQHTLNKSNQRVVKKYDRDYYIIYTYYSERAFCNE